MWAYGLSGSLASPVRAGPSSSLCDGHRGACVVVLSPAAAGCGLPNTHSYGPPIIQKTSFPAASVFSPRLSAAVYCPGPRLPTIAPCSVPSCPYLLLNFSSLGPFRMSTIQLSFSKLLEEICQKLGVGTPDCIATLGAEGWFVAYIDLPIARSGAIIEIACCWGAASPDILLAKDDSARVAIQRMKAELDLHIKDINYDDCIMYKSMYDNVTVQFSDLLGQFNKLKREHGILRDCYASSVAEKVRYIDEHMKMRRMIAEYNAAINRLRADRATMATDPSESGSDT
uniref:Uncharacterized protein n=1 Tax=Ananas comosus var. bracteatus TaxID=296719 RepID=A0A6V7PAS7_ANACO|nr:unnamed protein product [Ananas comosus var. bracteatus]